MPLTLTLVLQNLNILPENKYLLLPSSCLVTSTDEVNENYRLSRCYLLCVY